MEEAQLNSRFSDAALSNMGKINGHIAVAKTPSSQKRARKRTT